MLSQYCRTILPENQGTRLDVCTCSFSNAATVASAVAKASFIDARVAFVACGETNEQQRWNGETVRRWNINSGTATNKWNIEQTVSQKKKNVRGWIHVPAAPGEAGPSLAVPGFFRPSVHAGFALADS